LTQVSEIDIGQGLDCLPASILVPIARIVPQKWSSISKAACYDTVFVTNRMGSTSSQFG